MRHHILVKWNDTCPIRTLLPIRALFLETLRIPRHTGCIPVSEHNSPSPTGMT